jgi:1-acyl-sn-glycerol-3-phosphate acyltransferase
VSILRGAAFAILATICSGLTFFAATVALVLDPLRGRPSHAISRLWGHALLAAAGARLVVVHGERFDPREPRVLVCNHASYLDIPALYAAFPGNLRFVARRSLLAMPFVGWSIALSGHFPIDRDDPRQAIELMRRVARRMRSRRISTVVFPEGTRSPDGRLQPIKAGAMMLPLEVGAPVQPLAIVGSRDVLPKGAWAPRRAGTIEIRVGEPIDVAGLAGSPGRKALTERVRASLISMGVPE